MSIEQSGWQDEVESQAETEPDLITNLGELGLISSANGTTPGNKGEQIPAGEFMAELGPYYLDYVTDHFIKRDLRRLKTIKSLADDLWAVHEQACLIAFRQAYSPAFNPPHPLVARVAIDRQAFDCYKARVATSNPKLSPAKGCRVIYGVGRKQPLFVPLLLFRASEEGTHYLMGKDKLPLSRSHFSRIIQTKIDDAGAEFKLPE